MTTKKTKKEETTKTLTILPPKFEVAEFTIRGNAPFVSNKFTAEAKAMMKAKQEAGSTAKKNTKREAKDFQRIYKESMHESTEGWHGLPASGFRNAMVSACKIAGFAMTRAKLSVFIEPDGFDKDDGTPLIRFSKGEPEYMESTVRLATGVCDIAPRAKWAPGWEAYIRVKYDADQFTLTDVANLLIRVGMQVGIGAGRPDSKTSCGMGWGTFDVLDAEGSKSKKAA